MTGHRQILWEERVRAILTDRGHDSDEIEERAEGFGQDYAEYADSPDAYVDALEEEYVDPVGCRTGRCGSCAGCEAEAERKYDADKADGLL